MWHYIRSFKKHKNIKPRSRGFFDEKFCPGQGNNIFFLNKSYALDIWSCHIYHNTQNSKEHKTKIKTLSLATGGCKTVLKLQKPVNINPR